MSKPTKAKLKGYNGRHGGRKGEGYETDADITISYNGIPVKWFIGDINFKKAVEIGCAKKDDKGITITNKDGHYWEAHGSCLGKAYQMFAWFNTETLELIDIRANKGGERTNFDQEIYNKLTR